MTKRQQGRPERRFRTWARQSITVGVAAAALAAAGATADATAAQAGVPAAAQRWTYLMTRSLTVTATGVQLRQTLGAERATGRARLAALAQAKSADYKARRLVTTATAVDTAAKSRHAAARLAVSTARRQLHGLTPRTTYAVTRAQNVVTAAERTLFLRKGQARTAAVALAKAKSAAAVTAGTVIYANNRVAAASAVVQATLRKIAALPTPEQLAAQAAAVSRSAVTAVRPTFTTADTVVVYGTTIHRSLAYAYRRMVADAATAGISISGGGFRTKQRQIELRTINGCPDVWTAPASSCRVPTAIPGRSLHELGMAVDITSGGRSLTSKSAAFKWLKIHADEYGFVNLPSEPWHWSITGG